MDIQERINRLIAEMSLQEKALLCSGRKFWFTRGIRSRGIEPYMVTDGPHGLRKQKAGGSINDSVNATCFPCACTMASTWDPELVRGVGERIAGEAKQEGVGIVLGPGANIKRSPLCGRNFEYYSEDPYLSGTLAGAFINGVQSKGIGTSLKHYAVNNQESNRMRIDAVVDERALREIYLASFERAVKTGHPYTLMCSYNRINGRFASENKWLCEDVLRGEWGFDGYVMTDWGAINDRVTGLKCGIELEMPGGSGESVKKIVEAVEKGDLDIRILNRAVRRLLEVNFKVNAAKESNYKYDVEEHHSYARKVAADGAVLLKNEGGMLPLKKGRRLTVLGELARTPRYQGSGSSLIRPNKISSPLEALSAQTEVVFAPGYNGYGDKSNKKLLSEALALAHQSEGPIVVFAGLTLFYESEGFDRKHLSLPPNQNELIDKLADAGKDVIVVLYGGSPVEMPWIDKVKAVFYMYLPGQAVGEAAADLLFGEVNPSGKLAETFPLSLKDTSCFNYFPLGPRTVEYRESIFVGYRYYDTAKKEVLFPFGYGLSYTEFAYSDLVLDKRTLGEGDSLTVSFKVTNIGARAGKETAQIYVSHPGGRVFRAEKELAGFVKVALEPGETKEVSLTLEPRAFCYYNINERGWRAEGGTYEIRVGASSRDIRLSEKVNIIAKSLANPYINKRIACYFAPDGTFGDEAFAEILGRTPPIKEFAKKPVTGDSNVLENRRTLFGRIFGFLMVYGSAFVLRGKDENSRLIRHFMTTMMRSNTLRSIATSNGGMLTMDAMDGLLIAFNGKFLRGIGRTMKAIKENVRYDKILREIETREK
jgi:beta-glucosidase